MALLYLLWYSLHIYYFNIEVIFQYFLEISNMYLNPNICLHILMYLFKKQNYLFSYLSIYRHSLDSGYKWSDPPGLVEPSTKVRGQCMPSAALLQCSWISGNQAQLFHLGHRGIVCQGNGFLVPLDEPLGSFLRKLVVLLLTIPSPAARKTRVQDSNVVPI